jgi:hypothetical protein
VGGSGTTGAQGQAVGGVDQHIRVIADEEAGVIVPELEVFSPSGP